MAINNFNVGVGTTSQLTRYRYVATGGETSISGADADGKTLSYTVGLEQVFLNGVNLVRGQDYTATNGTTISNLTALVASDSLEVFAYVPFNIANAVTASTVDAKGDLLVGTGADTVGRLAVGSNDAVLSAASGETSGLAWKNSIYFAARISTNQSINNTTWTKMQFDTELFDSGTCYDPTTNYRFTVPTGGAGRYMLGVDAAFGIYSVGHQFQLAFYKNGSNLENNAILWRDSGSDVVGGTWSKLVNLNAGDYIEAYVYQNRGSAATLYSPNANFWGYRI